MFYVPDRHFQLRFYNLDAVHLLVFFLAFLDKVSNMFLFKCLTKVWILDNKRTALFLMYGKQASSSEMHIICIIIFHKMLDTYRWHLCIHSFFWEKSMENNIFTFALYIHFAAHCNCTRQHFNITYIKL